MANTTTREMTTRSLGRKKREKERDNFMKGKGTREEKTRSHANMGIVYVGENAFGPWLLVQTEEKGYSKGEF